MGGRVLMRSVATITGTLYRSSELENGKRATRQQGNFLGDISGDSIVGHSGLNFKLNMMGPE